jgi:hypothetical protein
MLVTFGWIPETRIAIAAVVSGSAPDVTECDPAVPGVRHGGNAPYPLRRSTISRVRCANLPACALRGLRSRVRCGGRRPGGMAAGLAVMAQSVLETYSGNLLPLQV